MDQTGIDVIVVSSRTAVCGETVRGNRESVEFMARNLERFRGYAATISNLYLETGGNPAYSGAMQALVELVGAERIMFGSGYPETDLAYQFGRIVLEPLHEDVGKKVASENARRLIFAK